MGGVAGGSTEYDATTPESIISNSSAKPPSRHGLAGTPTAAAGRFNADAFAPLQARAEFAGHLFDVAIVVCDECFSQRAHPSSGQAPGSVRTAVGEESYIAVGEYFDLANDAIAAVKLAVAAAFSAQRVGAHAQRIGVFESLRWSVQGIRHVRVHSGNAWLRWARAHSAGDGFVVSEWKSSARVDAPDGHIVHGARCRGWNAVRYCLGQGTQEDVDNALRGLDIASGYGGWRSRIDDGSFRCDDLDGAHESCGRGNIIGDKAAEDVEAR